MLKYIIYKNLKLIYLVKINIYTNGVPLTTIKMVLGRGHKNGGLVQITTPVYHVETSIHSLAPLYVHVTRISYGKITGLQRIPFY